jgi:hypothetical protein
MMMIVIIIIIIHRSFASIDHISMPNTDKKQYIKKHDREGAQLHFNICKETGVQLDAKHWYEHVPKSVETSRGG